MDGTDITRAYQELRERLVVLLENGDPVGELRVPACPEWSVRELMAHVVGVQEDILAGRLDGAGSNAWTHAQVERHANDSIEDLARALVDLAPAFDPVLPHFPVAAGGQFLMDVVTHEHDLRDALGQPGAQDSPAVTIGLDWLTTNVPFPDGVVADVQRSSATPYVAMRALSGRLSMARMTEEGLPAQAIAAAFAGTPFSIPAD
jgi:uncharacterized protein (TIGR03083 family)